MCHNRCHSACSELDDIAADFAALLTTPCTIEHKGEAVKSKIGGTTYTSPTAYKTFCRVNALKSPRQGAEANQITSQGRLQILLPLNTPVTTKDTIIASGFRYDIITLDIGKTDAYFLTADVSLTAK